MFRLVMARLSWVVVVTLSPRERPTVTFAAGTDAELVTEVGIVISN